MPRDAIPQAVREDVIATQPVAFSMIAVRTLIPFVAGLLEVTTPEQVS